MLNLSTIPSLSLTLLVSAWLTVAGILVNQLTMIRGLVTTNFGHTVATMLEGLLGSDDAERVLFFLAVRQRGYGREMAEFWTTSISGIQRQLDKLEIGGVLIALPVGRTRVYEWNPRWPLHGELLALLHKAVTFLPDDLRVRLMDNRRRPRRRGKPQ